MLPTISGYTFNPFQLPEFSPTLIGSSDWFADNHPGFFSASFSACSSSITPADDFVDYCLIHMYEQVTNVEPHSCLLSGWNALVVWGMWRFSTVLVFFWEFLKTAGASIDPGFPLCRDKLLTLFFKIIVDNLCEAALSFLLPVWCNSAEFSTLLWFKQFDIYYVCISSK